MNFRSLLLLAAVAACDRAETPAPPLDSPPIAPAGWAANPAGVVLATGGDTLRLTTGPHVIAWDSAAPELVPPYRVAATLHKRSGRLHEGVGLIFGGTGLDQPESGQVYSYFLVRGDGSFLVKTRQGAETPVVRDWTRHPAIRRDGEEGGRPNDLRVTIADTVAVFEVNDAEVARVPAADLAVRGRAGIRASHDVELTVSDFSAGVKP